MADVKISQLPVATTPLDGTEVLPIVQSATTKQVSIANVTAGRAVSALSLSLTNALPVTSGGTGIATAAQGSLLSATGADTFSATRTPTLGLAGTAAGTLGLSGSTSGVVTLATASGAAGTWTMRLPTTGGTNNYLLKTDGSGNTDWVNPTALGIDLDVGTTAITNGTAGRVFFQGSGDVLQQSANLFWDNTNSRLGIGTASPAGPLQIGATPSLLLDTSGNLGLGVTPSAWSVGAPVFQTGTSNGSASIFANGANDFWMLSNSFFDGAAFKYIKASTATAYEQLSGQHIWYIAPSGAAGGTVSFAQALTLSAVGNLTLKAVGSTAGQATTYYVSGPDGLNSGYTSYGMQTNGSDTTKPRCALFTFGSTYAGSYQALVANSTVLSAAYCDLSFNTETNHNINFYPYGAYAGRFDSAGNFLVGTATTGGGKVCIKNTPTSQWGIDFNESAVSIANGSNAALPSGSGMIVITDPTQSGATAMYIMGAATVALASTVNATFVAPTTTPGAGTASIQYGSGAYRIYNNIGTTINFKVAMFRTRSDN